MKLSLLTVAAATGLAIASPAAASDRYLGEVFAVAFSFCPAGTISAEGQLLEISKNPALFALLGTSFGGDGRTSFAVPDLRGRSLVGQGRPHGAALVTMGETDTVYGAKTADADTPRGVHSLAIQYCIVTTGIFPSQP